MENFTLGPRELAMVMGYQLATVLRLMTQAPNRLPPAVLLGESGKKGKRRWLRSTVEGWLKAREAPDVIDAAPVVLRAVVPGHRKPGRPRKSRQDGAA